VIRVCQGTACHVQGADEVAEAVKDELGVEEGETTKDRLFTLEFVNCLGCCSLAPVMVVNEVGVHAKMGAEKARRIIRKLRREGK
jgi:NADH-quinone oxidoreductase subunit E